MINNIEQSKRSFERALRRVIPEPKKRIVFGNNMSAETYRTAVKAEEKRFATEHRAWEKAVQS